MHHLSSINYKRYFSDDFHHLYLLFILAFSVRLIFVLLYPALGGDADIYLRVASNIVNGCGVAISEANAETCIPHFGGNQGPGYPSFVALNWWLFDHSNLATRITQNAVLCSSIIYFVLALEKFMTCRKKATIIGIIIAVSPCTVAWPRFMQTETLALAGTLWIFSALLNSVTQKKLQILSISVALTFTSFIRLDAVALIVPICFTALNTDGFKKALKNLIIVGVIVSIPWAGWMVRNYNVGLSSVLPQTFVVPGGGAEPKGYLMWVRSWMTNTYHNTNTLYPPNRLIYSSISFDPEIFASDEERRTVETLQEELQFYDGKPFPEHIDHEFKLLAEERISNQPFNVFFVNPLKRTMSMWSNPFNSFGWPTELDANFSKSLRIEIAKGDFKKLLEVAFDNLTITMNKALIAAWRLAFLAAFIFVLIVTIVKKSPNNFMIFSTLSFIVTKSLLVGYFNPETRYIMTTIPLIEASVIYYFLNKNWRLA